MLRQLALQARVLQMSVVRCSAPRSLRVEVAVPRTQIRSLHVQLRLFLSICALYGSEKHFAFMLAGCDRALPCLLEFPKMQMISHRPCFSVPRRCVPAAPLCRSGASMQLLFY